MLKKLFLIILLFGISPNVFPLEPPLTQFAKIRTDAQLQSQVRAIVRVGIDRAFGKNSPLPELLDPFFKKQIPIFVTVKKKDEVRGCMGSLKPKKSSLAEEIEQNLILAFSKDPRHRPIAETELNQLEIFITAVGTPLRITRVEEISPAHDGAMIRRGNKEAILLPGEAKTQRYLVAALRSKAGIKKNETFQLYRVPSVTFSVLVNAMPTP